MLDGKNALWKNSRNVEINEWHCTQNSGCYGTTILEISETFTETQAQHVTSDFGFSKSS